MILTYHKIGTQFEVGITTVRRQDFRAHLEFLESLEIGFAVATRMIGETGVPEKIAITFDDGYESVYTEAAREMASRDIPGTVFPVVGSIGGHNRWDVRLSPRPFKHLSWAQLRELVELGFEVGSHTLSHRDLTRLNPADLQNELRVSREMLEDGLGIAIRAVSYPFGRFSKKVISEALDAGYSYGFTSFPRAGGNPMAVGRMSVYAIDGTKSLRRKLRLDPGYRLEYVKNRLIAGLSLGTTLIKK
jgi:peptidoglycan/xylan/chitin deacetylase (PgdA/CDA1 family)